MSGDQSIIARQALIGMGTPRRGRGRAECPFCAALGHQDRKRSFVLKVSTGWYSCYKCKTIGKLRDLPRRFDAFKSQSRNESTEYLRPPVGFIPLARAPGLGSLAMEPARRYLRERGLNEDRWLQHGLGACLSGRYAGRVVIPIMDREGKRWMGWIARCWFSHPKPEVPYRYPSGMLRSDFLYNGEVLAEETDRPAFLVEGAFDALPMPRDAFATLGAWTDEHMELIMESKRPIVVCRDPDEDEVSRRLAWRLRLLGIRAGYLELPAGQDPASICQSGALQWLLREGEGCLKEPARPR